MFKARQPLVGLSNDKGSKEVSIKYLLIGMGDGSERGKEPGKEARRPGWFLISALILCDFEQTVPSLDLNFLTRKNNNQVISGFL